jgi:hypothetical protein
MINAYWLKRSIGKTWKILTGSTYAGRCIFKYQLPFDPGDFAHFRHRFDKEGMEKILQQSIDLFGADFIHKEVMEVRVDKIFKI